MRNTKSNMAVGLCRIRFFYKLRPFNVTESLIRYGKVILMKEETFCLLSYYGELIWCSFHSHTRRASCVRCLHTSRAVFGLEEFFPPGVIEKGELAPESVNTGICLYLRYPLGNFCCHPPSPPSLKSKDLLFVEQRQGYFAERRTLYAECRMPNDSEV